MTTFRKDPVTEARKLKKQLRKAKKQLSLAKTALKYYGDAGRYQPDYWGYTHASEHDSTPDIVYDKGEVANRALKEIGQLKKDEQ